MVERERMGVRKELIKMDIPFGMDWSRTDVQTSKQIVSKIFIKKDFNICGVFLHGPTTSAKNKSSQGKSNQGLFLDTSFINLHFQWEQLQRRPSDQEYSQPKYWIGSELEK